MPHSASACFRKIRKITKKIEMDRYERVWTLETYSLNFSFTSYLAHSTLRHRQSDMTGAKIRSQDSKILY